MLTVAGCFTASWLVWLVIGFVTYDPFDDDLAPWLASIAVIFGTPCGAILSLVALAVIELHLRFRAQPPAPQLAHAARGQRPTAP